MEPQEFVEMELRLLHQMFDVQRVIHPMVILVKDDKRYLVPVHYQNAAHKDIISQGIKDLVKKSEPDIVIYVAEAYVRVLKGPIDLLPTSISPNSPDKEEVLIVQIEFKTGEKYGAEARIIQYGGTRLLKNWKVVDSDTSMGRFVDFFPIKRLN
jgi:hypothetical protein